MSTSPTSKPISKQRNFFHLLVSGLGRFLWLTFYKGPKQLLTARISGKCAAIMALLCLPSYVGCALLALPGMIFQRPQLNAYYFLDAALNQDPARWLVLGLAAMCALLSLTVAATQPEPEFTYDY